MKLTGKVEEKKGNLATILVTKVLPCGDKCRSCSAGCKHYSLHIQSEVEENVNIGDIVKVEQKGDAPVNNTFIRYAIPVAFIACSLIIVELLPIKENISAILALAILISIIASYYISKFYDKVQMKRISKHYTITK